MNACFCVGPQDGQPFCPCKMREKRKHRYDDFMRGYELGLKQGRSDHHSVDPDGEGALS